MKITEAELLDYVRANFDRFKETYAFDDGEELTDSLPTLEETSILFAGFLAEHGLRFDSQERVYEYDPAQRAAIEAEVAAIIEEYDDREAGTRWEKYGLQGDDDVDYNGGYVQMVVELLDDYARDHGQR